jgi:hypothetical protein
VLWLAVWTALGWIVGFTFYFGHAWVVLPIMTGIHGFIAGVAFALFCAWYRRKMARLSALNAATFGALAGIIALGALRLLTWFSMFIPLVVVPLDALFALFLWFVLFRRPSHETQPV